MSLRLLALAASWSFLLISCKEVSFREPQPTGILPLKEVPEQLRGSYLARDEQTDEKGDTLLIESWGYHFKDSNDKDWLGRGVLSDSLIIKFYEDYYFLNFRSADQWVLRLIKQKPNGDIEFLSIDLQAEDKTKAMVKKLSKKVKVTEIKRKDDTFYQISPTPAQLMGLIKEGFFTGTTLQKK